MSPGVTQDPQRIVIVGSGLAAWMSAATLAATVRADDFSITVVGSRDAGDGLSPFGAADATMPTAEALHPALYLDEDRLIAATESTYTLGIALTGWTGPEDTYFQPFGACGAPIGPVPFHQLLARMRQTGTRARLANYSLAALAAQAGRFERPSEDPGSVLSTLRYGIHLECERLSRGYAKAARSAGVRQVPGALAHVETDDRSQLHAVLTDRGKRVEGDLFLDCTGVRARLIRHLCESGWEDWSAWLPGDRVVRAASHTGSAPAPFSHAEAHHGGWVRSLPFKGRTLYDVIYRSDLMTEEQALFCLGGDTPTAGLSASKPVPVRFGRRSRPWCGNCVALGTAGALIDPVGISNLQLLRSGLSRLLGLLPPRRKPGAERMEYNRQVAAELDNARDFAIAHYRLNGRQGEPLWDDCRTMEVPETLDYKLRLYESRGRVALYDEEPMEETGWINLFDEHGIRPRQYSALADGFSVAQLETHLRTIRTVMIDTVDRMPSHAEFLDSRSPAREAT